jgi:serine/threonine-protein kinase
LLIHKEYRAFLTRQERLEDARMVWVKALELNPPEHEAWYGYAELCLFLGKEEEYHRARQVLLAKFDSSPDPNVIERTSRSVLLSPSSEEELRRAIDLVNRLAAVDRTKFASFFPYAQFALGLTEYRQNHFEKAIAVMQGDAGKVLGPAPKLVTAMAMHKNGQAAEARKILATAIITYDWSPRFARDQDVWIYHILRREAESLMLPNLQAFLDGKHQPQDQPERDALLGVCQFSNRTVALSRLYADIFAAGPHRFWDLTGHRFRAARVAALAGSGRGLDATDLSETERMRWRAQSRQWLRISLAAWSKFLSENPKAREQVRQALKTWQTEPDLACLREQSALDKLSVDERNDCLAVWQEVADILRRAH